MASAIPSKEMCVADHAKIQEYLMKNFVENLKEHHSKGHKFFIQGSVDNISRDLFIDRQLAIYLILGSCATRKNWGELKEVQELEPIKYILRKEVVRLGKETLDGYGFKVYFGDTARNGNFKMKVDFYPYPPKKEGGEEGEGSAETPADGSDSADNSAKEFKKVSRKPFVKRNNSKAVKPVSEKREWAAAVSKPAAPAAPRIPVYNKTDMNLNAMANKLKELEAKLASLSSSE
jgi:hypothetical protein